MMASFVTVVIFAVVEAVLSMREALARRRSATPVRRQRTAVLNCRTSVPMTGMCVPMISVTGRESCAHPNNTDSCDDLIACTESDTCSGWCL